MANERKGQQDLLYEGRPVDELSNEEAKVALRRTLRALRELQSPPKPSYAFTGCLLKPHDY